MTRVSDLRPFLDVCERASRAGGAVLLDWAGRFQVHEKGPADLVTEADLASQDTVRKILLDAFPDHGFLGEENLSIPPSADGYRWIVDPLDGTTNYVHAIPHFCVSIALEHHGRLVVGTVYDPVADECFTAIASGGAFVNGRPLQTSGVTRLDQAVAAMSFPARLQRESPELDEFCVVAVEAQTMRRFGSSALNLCYVAAGRFDVYWASSTKIWDIAAGVLMVLEAGGIVTDRSGIPFRIDRPQVVAASTTELHANLQGALAQAARRRK